MSFSDYLQLLKNNREGVNLPPDRVPDTRLFAFVGDEIVGRVGIRHTLNEYLATAGGHIGYHVITRYRRRGYATEMLRLALPIARGVGITRALITCDDGNIASAKTIEKNGGVFESVLSGNPAKRRYWIDL
jgi:predicted acetyltransferase